jgi:glyoxylase-like metal-dependent hydrolase (beta-lactamase superfamily II)
MYRFFSDNIGYVLIEPRTRQLILIDAGDFDTSKKVVSEIEK